MLFHIANFLLSTNSPICTIAVSYQTPVLSVEPDKPLWKSFSIHLQLSRCFARLVQNPDPTVEPTALGDVGRRTSSFEVVRWRNGLCSAAAVLPYHIILVQPIDALRHETVVIGPREFVGETDESASSGVSPPQALPSRRHKRLLYDQGKFRR